MSKNVNSIAFCGIDGSGKSTALNHAFQLLSSDKLIVDKTQFMVSPAQATGQASTSLAKDYLKIWNSGFKMVIHYLKSIYDKETADIILQDRHLMCLLAHAYAEGISRIDLLKHLFSIFPPFKDPDLIIYFDVEVKTALERIEAERDILDRHENYESLSKIKDGYEILIPCTKNIEIINANQSLDEVNKQIEQVLSKKLK